MLQHSVSRRRLPIPSRRRKNSLEKWSETTEHIWKNDGSWLAEPPPTRRGHALTTTTAPCWHGGRKNLIPAMNLDTLRDRRKGDPQHKCCGNKRSNICSQRVQRAYHSSLVQCGLFQLFAGRSGATRWRTNQAWKEMGSGPVGGPQRVPSKPSAR